MMLLSPVGICICARRGHSQSKHRSHPFRLHPLRPFPVQHPRVGRIVAVEINVLDLVDQPLQVKSPLVSQLQRIPEVQLIQLLGKHCLGHSRLVELDTVYEVEEHVDHVISTTDAAQ